MPIQIKHLEEQIIYFENILPQNSKQLNFKDVVVSSIML